MKKEMAPWRAAWIPQARGDVLEVGIGSGLDLAFYSSEVSRVFGIDPSVQLQRIAPKRAAAIPVHVEFLSQRVETSLPLANESMDTAVLTWTLCCIANPAKALHEIRRVLNPSGRFSFVEHGGAPDQGVALRQDRLTPIEAHRRRCHLNRKIDEMISAAGFKLST
jgi:ubiquinone/menaquinone biosynthesis C-methylase UbiE